MAISTTDKPNRREPAPGQDPLLNTRLFVPPARPGLVERPRLIEAIEEGLKRKLLLITAPAGSGKTTLLSSWRSSEAGSRWPFAWVSLTESDNEPHRFWSYAIAALDKIQPGTGAEALAVIRPPEQAETERALTELINSLSSVSTDLVLVLDDYHLIHTPAIQAAVGFFIEHMPPQVHLIIAGQEEPPLPLPRLRARAQLSEIHAADLRFTLEETAAFFNRSMGLNLSASDVAEIDERTEGWAAGLQLVALALQGAPGAVNIPASTGSHRFIIEYLATEVLNRQPEAVQNFLLKTSILERFTAELCDAVTDEGTGLEMLDHLERANLFLVPLDAEQRWYRYHHLFAGFLRTHLERTLPGQLPELHCRAAGWYEQAGMAPEAIAHYLSARDFDRAAGMIEDTARPMFMRSEVKPVLSWLDALPPDLVSSRPWLGLVRAWGLSHDYRVEEAEQCLQDVGRSMAAPNARGHNGPLSYTDRFALSGEMAVIRARLAAFRGQTERVIDIAEQMLRSLPVQYSFSRSELALSLSFAYMDREDLDAARVALDEAIAMCRAAGNTRGVMYAVRTLGALYMMRGQLHKAVDLYNRHLEEAAQSPNAPQISDGFLHAALSPVLLEWNDLDGALEHAQRAVDLAREGGDGKILLLGYVPLVLAQQARGEWRAANEGVEKLNRLRPSRYNTAVQAAIWLAQGNVEAVAAWSRSSGLDPASEPSYPEEYENLILARVLYAEGQTGRAIPLLEKMLARADKAGRAGSALYVRIWLALCLLDTEERARAVEMIVPALTLAGTEGYVRSFLDGGPAMAALLRLVLNAYPSGRALPEAADAARHLLGAFPAAQPANGRAANQVQSATPHPASSPLAEPLSEREIEVLRLIESGLSNQEIAGRLVVTVGTVKTHLRNVYGKLNVHSRTQALARAHSLNLI